MKFYEIKNKANAFNRNYFYLAIISVAALLATFYVSNAELSFQAKTTIFISLVVFYLLLSATIYTKQKKLFGIAQAKTDFDSPFGAEIEAKLLAFEEASQFFGASLKAVDLFRLVASRISELIDYSAGAFYIADENKEKLKLTYAAGNGFEKIIGTEIDWRAELAGKTFQMRKPQIEKQLSKEKNPTLAAASKNLTSAISIPLLSNDRVFGVFVLYSKQENEFDENSLRLFEAVGTRIAPLFISSQAFEHSLTNALTDALTRLPNERAFYLVLENQIAESQRFREVRPLTVLAIDIRDFTEHNQRFGHATGDNLLLFAADKIKKQLRQMDFLARSISDEFLAVLPTASEIVAQEIVKRIEREFVTNPFEISGKEKIYLRLDFGAASFGRDGEAAGQLLKHAIVRKQQSKASEKGGNILWFPKDYVN